MGSGIPMDWIEEWMEKLKEKIKQVPLRNAMVIFFLIAFIFITILYFLTVQTCDNCINMLKKIYFSNEDYFEKEDMICYIEYAATPRQKAKNRILFFYFLKRYNLIFYIPIGIYIASYFYYKEKLKEPLRFLHQGAEHLAENDLDFSFTYNSKDEMGEICQTFENMRFQLVENQKEIWEIIENQRQCNAMFAHDLRTPLTVMHGYLDMLKKYHVNLSEEKLVEILKILTRQVERMEQFSDTMKELQGMEDLIVRKKSANLQELCQKIEENIKGLSGKIPIMFEVLFSAEPFFCNFDEASILEVLDNMIGNALRYAKTRIEVKVDLEHDMFLLYVKDDGCGFSKEDKKNAFQPYYSGEGKEHGHFGLGLTIANQLCHKHGGKLEITNSIYGGAIVCAMFSII